MSLENFDTLVSELEELNRFYNQLNNIQISMKKQVLIILKYFGIYKNNIFLYKATN